jgi:LAS superfamily LD-carboxypeptidase LdcB
MLFGFRLNTSTAEYPIVPALSEAADSLPKARITRANNAVFYQYPDFLTRQVVLARSDLMRGNMMRIDAEHPLPTDAPAPNTLRISTNGKGLVPVRDLALKTGRETIEALKNLFSDARQKGIEGLVVWRGSMSEAEQREWQLERVREYASSMSINEAVQKAREEVGDPRTSDFQQEFTVDIRLSAAAATALENKPHGLTNQGRYLSQNAWRFGFVRRYPSENNHPFRKSQFRYVGVAHSTAMTYLDLDIESYLELLHEKKVLQVRVNGAVKYLILCEPRVGDYIGISLPEHAEHEASYDNMGYVIVACTLS